MYAGVGVVSSGCCCWGLVIGAYLFMFGFFILFSGVGWGGVGGWVGGW